MIQLTPVDLRDFILFFTIKTKSLTPQPAAGRTGQRWRPTRAVGSSKVRLLHRVSTGPCPGESVGPTPPTSHFGVMR